jgi:hypothetical protein
VVHDFASARSFEALKGFGSVWGDVIVRAGTGGRVYFISTAYNRVYSCKGI